MSAILNLPGFLANVLAANDDGFSLPTDIGFPFLFYKRQFSSIIVNNNGILSFPVGSGTGTGPNGNGGVTIYTPYVIQTSTAPIICPFFADFDTRPNSPNLVTYGQDVMPDGRKVFGANYLGIGYYKPGGPGTDRLNRVQILIIDDSSVTKVAGDATIRIAVSQIQWETGDASGGHGGLGGISAAVGFTAGTQTVGEFVEFGGSRVNGSFLDNNLNSGLIHNSYPMTNPLGVYEFPVRSGAPQGGGPPDDGGGPPADGGSPTIPTGDLGGVVTPTPATLGTTVTLSNGLSDYSHAPGGGYKITHIPIGWYSVTFSECGYYPQTFPVTITPNALTTRNCALVALSTDDANTGFFIGSVMDLQTALPLASAVVTATDADGIATATSTDLNGAWTLQLPAGTYTFTVQAMGYDLFTWPNPASIVVGCTVNVGIFGVPPPANAANDADVYGYTEDAVTQAALAGVTVAALELPAFTTPSADDGAYELRYLPAPRSITLFGSKPAYRDRRVQVVLASGEAQRVDLGLVPLTASVGNVDGFLTDAATSAPIAGGVVRVPGVTQAVTNSQGYFVLYDLPVGAVALQATADGYLAAQAAVTVVVNTTTRQNMSLTSASGATTGVLYGQVRDGVTGAGLVGAAVSCDLVTGVSGARGAYLLTGFPCPPRSHTVTATDAGYYPLTLAGVPIREGQSLALDLGMTSLSTPVGTLHGYTFDAYPPNLKVPGALVSVGRFYQAVTGSPNADYLVAYLPANTVYTATASADGYLPTTYHGVEVGVNQDLELDFPLVGFGEVGQYGILTVTVLTAGSLSPVEGATVDLGRVGIALGTTDASGQYTFPAIPVGGYTVAVTKPGYRVGSQAVTVTTGQNNARVLLYGFPAGYTGGQFYGHVTALLLPPGQGVPDCLVSASPGYVSTYGRGDVVTDANGFYVMDDVPVGGSPYALTFDESDYDLLVKSGIVALAQTPVRVDAQLSPFDGRLPAGWRIVFSEAETLSRPVAATVLALNESEATTQLRRLDSLSFVCQADTNQLSRYRRVRYDTRTATETSTPLLRSAVALAPGVQIHGWATMAVAVPDPLPSK